MYLLACPLASLKLNCQLCLTDIDSLLIPSRMFASEVRSGKWYIWYSLPTNERRAHQCTFRHCVPAGRGSPIPVPNFWDPRLLIGFLASSQSILGHPHALQLRCELWGLNSSYSKEDATATEFVCIRSCFILWSTYLFATVMGDHSKVSNSTEGQEKRNP